MTTITIDAHCDSDTKEVVVFFRENSLQSCKVEETILQAGESSDFTVIGDGHIVVRELPKRLKKTKKVKEEPDAVE